MSCNKRWYRYFVVDSWNISKPTFLWHICKPVLRRFWVSNRMVPVPFTSPLMLVNRSSHHGFCPSKSGGCCNPSQNQKYLKPPNYIQLKFDLWVESLLWSSWDIQPTEISQLKHSSVDSPFPAVLSWPTEGQVGFCFPKLPGSAQKHSCGACLLLHAGKLRSHRRSKRSLSKQESQIANILRNKSKPVPSHL